MRPTNDFSKVTSLVSNRASLFVSRAYLLKLNLKILKSLQLEENQKLTSITVILQHQLERP